MFTMRKCFLIFSVLILFLFLLSPAFAFDNIGFAGGPEVFINNYLTENNFPAACIGLGWMDISSGETYYINEDKFFVSGSMYKLPLNMLFCDKINSGELSSDSKISGYNLIDAMKLSMVKSDNTASGALRVNLTYDFMTYRRLLASYSEIETEELPTGFYSENMMSPRFFLNTLRYLSENSCDYDLIINFMKEANQESYFCYYPPRYTVAHKYGNIDGNMSDCCIEYAKRPFLLVVFLSGAGRGEITLSEIRGLFEDYSDYLYGREEIARIENLIISTLFTD